MPEFDKLNSYADEAALKQETAFILSEFEKVIAGGNAMVDALLSAQKKLNFGNTGTKELSDGIDKLTEKTGLYGKQVTFVAAEQKRLAENTAILAKATAEETASLEKNIESRRRLQNSLDSYKATQKEDLQLMKAGTITRQEYNQRLTDSQIKIEQYKNKLSDLDKTIKSQTATDKTRAAEIEAAAKKEKKAIDDLANDYKILSAAYNDAALKAKNYALQLGTKHPLTLQAAADAKVLGDKLKEVDASVGQNQRNVGNYAGSLGGYFNKIFGPLRTLANILPGIGLSGLFLLAFEAITSSAQALGLFNNKLFDTKEQSKLLADINEKASESAGKEAGQLQILRSQLENTNVPMATRLQAVKDIKKEYPDYFNGLTTEQILTGNVGNAYDKAADAILRKARANAAAAEIEKLTSENLKKDLAIQLAAEQARAKIKSAKDDTALGSGSSSGMAGGNFGGVSKAAKQKSIAEDFAAESKGATESIALNNRKIAFLLKFTDQGAKETVKIETEKNQAIKESTKEIFDAEYEERKRQLQRRIKLLEEDVNNEKLSKDKRIAVLQEFSNASFDLIKLESEKEKSVLQEKQATLLSNLKQAKGTEKNNIIAELKDTAARIKDIDNKAAFDRLSVFDTNQKKFTSIMLTGRREMFLSLSELAAADRDKEQNRLKEQYEDDITALNTANSKGLLSKKEYQDKRAKLDLAYHIESLQNEIKYAKAILKIQALTGKNMSKAKADLAEAERKLSDLLTGHVVNNENKKVDATLKALNTIKNVGEQVFGVLSGVLNANLIATKNALKEQSDAAEKKAAREIELINASADSEEKKAARIALVNASLAAQKEQIARKEREAEQKKAAADKAISIFRITLNTAMAVSNALSQGDPYTALARAIAVGALGAAELAIAIATPIPKFKHGKSASNKYQGPAIVDDGGVPEFIERADGTIEAGGNKPRLTYVGKDDIVHKNKASLMESMQKSALSDVAALATRRTAVSSGDQFMQRMMLQMAEREVMLLEKIADKPVADFSMTEKGIIKSYQFAGRRVTLLNEMTDF